MAFPRVPRQSWLAAALAVGVLGGGAGAHHAAGAGKPAAALIEHTMRHQTGDPVATITDPGDVSIGSLFALDAGQSQGDIVDYTWDFGDGSAPGSGKSVRYAYPSVDDYTIMLTVQDRQGRTNSVARTLRVVPALGALTGDSEIGQIVPASSFTAFLAMNASGPAQVSARLGGTFLYSDRWDFQGGNAPTLLEIPDVRVVNEDDADLADLMARRVNTVPLINNVTVTLSYLVTSGKTESVSYTTSLLRPGLTMAPQPSPAAEPPPAAPQASAPGGTGQGGQPRPTLTPGPHGYYNQSQPTPNTLAPPGPPPPPPPLPALPVVAPASPPAIPVSQPPFWSISYPSYLAVVGLPVPSDDVDGYYLRGDKDFHAAEDTTVRRFAIKIARNGGVFPNDPQRAADNIYRYVNGLLGIGDPGDLITDVQVVNRIIDGSLVPGARRGEFICIAHAYFVSSLTRMLGLPTRELTVGFGRGNYQDNTGAWHLTFYQEGANEVWFAGAWHHYDTWIGTRNRADYLDSNLAEYSFYAFSAQHSVFKDVNGHSTGLVGHDFSIGKFVALPGSPDQWRPLDQLVRPGITIAEPGPEAYQDVSAAPRAPRFETVVAGIREPGSIGEPAGMR